MIEAVIFDFDNTLEQWIIPDAGAKVAIAEELENKYRIDKAEFLTFFNKLDKVPRNKKRDDTVPWDWSRENWFSIIFSSLNVPASPKLFEKKYWNFVNNRVSLFPNVETVLKELRKRKIKLIILSDSDGRKSLKMKRIKILGIEKYFDFIFTTDDVGVNKPNRKVYDFIIKKTGINPKKTIAIGDHPESDLAGAKKMGMVTVWDQEAVAVSARFRYVDYIVKDIIELLDIVDRESRR